MKFALLFACLVSATLIHAQTSSPTIDQNRITITVSNDGLYILSKSKVTTLHSNEALDSCLQKMISGLDHPTILLDTSDHMGRLDSTQSL